MMCQIRTLVPRGNQSNVASRVGTVFSFVLSKSLCAPLELYQVDCRCVNFFWSVALSSCITCNVDTINEEIILLVYLIIVVAIIKKILISQYNPQPTSFIIINLLTCKTERTNRNSHRRCCRPTGHRNYVKQYNPLLLDHTFMIK